MIASIRSIFRGDFFGNLVAEAQSVNESFTADSISYAVRALESEFLDEVKFTAFCESQQPPQLGFKIGVLCAGNLPLVGFGDMFYALLCGCSVALKCSRRDPLMRAFAQLDGVELVEDLSELNGCDAILAMGSDATCTTLQQLHPTIPMLLRGSMHSVAVLDGTESVAELSGLVDDVFVHGGMGCRSVSHLYVPMGYDFGAFGAAVTDAPIAPQSWTDSVTYNRAMMTMQGLDFIDMGAILLTQTPSMTPGVLSYSHYSTTPPAIDPERTQFVSRRGTFGTGQRPTLCDFPNSQNVITFLRSL